jgi:hypothetical protein
MNTHEAIEAPQTRIHHHPAGWTFPFLSPDPQNCTTNHIPDNADQPPCTATATWKVVEIHEGLALTLSFWCDGHLPDEHRHLATHPA